MIKKIVFILCLFSLVFASLSPVFVYAQEETQEEEYDFASMTTYEMFWPVTAGKVPGDRLYKLKTWRDKLMGFLYFSQLKKSEYLKQLANKRLVEAERLLEIQRFSYLSETLKTSREDLEEGLVLLSSASESDSQFWLKNEYAKDLQKHLVVLERMKEKVEEKEAIEESIKKVKELIEEHKLVI